MNRFCEWLIAQLAGALTADERDAVLGDLAEASAAPSQVVRDLLDLALRRQAAQWLYWRPWLTLVGMAIPFAILLRLAATYLAHNSAVYIWMFADNWDPALLDIPGYRHDLGRAATSIMAISSVLAFASWLVGRALASACRATRVVNAVVVALLLVPAAAHEYGVNRAVFAVTFYRVVYPLFVNALLVIAPCWLGIWRRKLNGTD
jgi:hypothetical protein